VAGCSKQNEICREGSRPWKGKSRHCGIDLLTSKVRAKRLERLPGKLKTNNNCATIKSMSLFSNKKQFHTQAQNAEELIFFA